MSVVFDYTLGLAIVMWHLIQISLREEAEAHH